MSFRSFAVLSSGHKIPTLGYGTWQAAPGEVGNGVYEALKAGYRHLDLAKIYGNQKEVAQGIKRAMKDVPSLRRDHLFITSKLWNNRHRPEEVEAALDETLAELELDYLDLYLIHFPVAFRSGEDLMPVRSDNSHEIDIDQSVTISQTWRAMTQLPQSKVRSIGVSNFGIKQVEIIIKDVGVVPAVNQFERHPKLQQKDLVAYCDRNQIHITGYSPFGNNSLGLPLVIHNPDVKSVAARLSRSRGFEVKPSQVVLAWAQANGRSVIPKSVTPDRIRENFQEVELDEDAIKSIEDIGKDAQRYNIPATWDPKWDINMFGDDKEKTAKYQVV